MNLGVGIPPHLRLVPVDFEAGIRWRHQLVESGFDAGRPAIVASTGVSMYLTREAIAATLRATAALAPGSTLAMSFMLAERYFANRADGLRPPNNSEEFLVAST